MENPPGQPTQNGGEQAQSKETRPLQETLGAPYGSSAPPLGGPGGFAPQSHGGPGVVPQGGPTPTQLGGFSPYQQPQSHGGPGASPYQPQGGPTPSQGGGFSPYQPQQPHAAAFPPQQDPYAGQPQSGFGQSQGPYAPPQGPPFGQPPVTNQPMAAPGPGMNGEWMRMPQGVPNCPPGLEYLTTIDSLLVHQLEDVQQRATSGVDTANRYTVHNSLGQKVYNANELSDSSMRSLWRGLRPFELKIMDNYGNLIMNLKRPLGCKWCCFPCCLQKMEVSAPPGNVVGKIEQEWGFLYPKFVIKTPSDDVVLRIEGPYCTTTCCSDADFKVMTPDGSNQVGKISKQWAGYNKDAVQTDNFGISFPLDLDVRMKAVMLGACFLIDMMYFESGPASADENKAGQQTQRSQTHQPI